MSTNFFDNNIARFRVTTAFVHPYVWSGAIAVVAMVVWYMSLGSIDMRQVNDLGLISALNLPFFLSILLLTVSFCIMINQPKIYVGLVLLYIVSIIFMIHGIAFFTQEVPRFETVYKHLGILEYIIRNEDVDPMLTAYFNWPGFFIMCAFIIQAAGLSSTMNFVAASSIFFNLLYIGPLLMIYKSATNDKRLIWLGVWVFYLSNWVGQDYFSPQALHYSLYLAIIGILLQWFQGSANGLTWLRQRWQRFGRVSQWLNGLDDAIIRGDSIRYQSKPTQRMLLIGIVIVLFAIIVPSHQLTPFAMLGSTAVLVIFSRSNARGLPILMALLIATWMSFMATQFLDNHMHMVVGQVGEVNQTLEANVTRRVQGSAEHIFVTRMRLITTAFLWAAAMLGCLYRLRKGYLNLSLVLLGATPFGLMMAANYGGEMIMRVYIFSLPFVAFFAAALAFPSVLSGRSWRTTIALVSVSLLLIGAFLFTRYGNERMDYFSSTELAGVEHLYEIAKPGDQLLAISYNLPWKYQLFEQYRYKLLADVVIDGDLPAIQQAMAARKNSYLIITRSQRAQLELFAGVSPQQMQRLDYELMYSGRYQLLYANQDAQIFSLALPEELRTP